MRQMRRRSPARWLAPLALIACAFAIYTVVDKGILDKDDGPTKTTTSKTSTGAGSASTTTKKKTTKKKSYTVKSGDTFSGIADKQGVDVDALQAANPDVNPGAISPGQKLKLPR
jgi:LysM repeat protein